MKIFLGEKANDLFKDEKFLEAWDQLFSLCPWATVFQSKEFVLTWYSIYNKYPSILLTDWDGRKLKGIFSLTINNKGEITAAGTNQAEYQVWLSTTEDSYSVLESSIKLIKMVFPNKPFLLKYLPPRSPVERFSMESKWSKEVILKTHLQPLMVSNEKLLAQELKKKNRKEKINRLRRKGDLSFEVISTIDEFLNIIDELILQSDFRKGAMYDKVIFQLETERKDFLIRLFELGLLHVSILKLDEEIIASNAGIAGKEMIHLQGINSHSPFYAKYSPGILHFLMLGIELGNAGINYFDLTPGGAKGYKEKLSNSSQEAYELKVLTPLKVKNELLRDAIKGKLKGLLEVLLKRNYQSFKIVQQIQNGKKKYDLLSKKGLEFFECDGINRVFSSQSKTYLTLNSIGKEELPKGYKISENKMADLLNFDESKGIITRKDFLYDCMKRIEIGHCFFCLMFGDYLCAVLWYVPSNVSLGELSSSQGKNINSGVLAFSYYQSQYLSETQHLLYSVIKKVDVPFPVQLQFCSSQNKLKKHLKLRLNG
ncbi:GNAT family N-acetyltransferase [Cyclobacterium sp. 1_MG-2023]|uniref:GNAT family N-acetyltransferase n=1 Tax=Cyclobacterium sp. 1_MG-2023 TaxID=3062681 RepID=UPI0026E32EEE|nr:GNAT family N-acetyltransferase [Cyclobacterium sp. 1_MG-2023]MDO6440362.1 GNAT family N-acetyltransferase [Cyclobacterium sp. 1_MG-2023]